MNTRDAELGRRLGLWRKLHEIGGPDGIRPTTIKELRIHRGQQGIFRDLEETGSLDPNRHGAAVGILHTGTVYDDDLYESGVIYHYPSTGRGSRDQNEIESLKNCRRLSLPLFVVITPKKNASNRNVRLAWVIDFDDEAGQCLIEFRESESLAEEQMPPSRDFQLKEPRRSGESTSKTRPNQWRFRYEVLKRYGATCALCQINELRLLEAAHLCPVESGGSDDERNGLVLCLNHHRALDEGMILINPKDLHIVFPMGKGGEHLNLVRDSIKHLKNRPHPDALDWMWMKRAGATT